LIAIIGGGISGLAAAYELATRRVPFILLEASGRTGGLVRTEHVDGFTIDAGADSFLATKPAGIELCEALGLGPRLMASTPPRIAYVHARDRLHALPSPSMFGIPLTWAGIALYGLLPLDARVRLAWLLGRHSAARGPTGRAERSGAEPADESVADFYRREFGPATVGLIAEPLLGGIHAGDVEQLSIAAIAPRLVEAARAGRLLHAPPPRRESEGLFKALRGGMSELVTAIEKQLPTGSVRLRSGAQAVARTSFGWRIGGHGETLDARAVIVAAPAHSAARILAAADPVLATLCAEVPYVSTASVALGWPRANITHPLQGSGFVVARRHSRLRITACTWVSSKWQDRAAPGMVLLRAFLGSATVPVDNLPDEALVEAAVRDVTSVIGASGPPLLVRVHRWPNAGAQHIVGHADRLARITGRLAGLPGLFVAGSGFRSIGVPDCIADGRAAAVQASRYSALESD
jgi:oxygen-dependent protoporphyrinogen oxidase